MRNLYTYYFDLEAVENDGDDTSIDDEEMTGFVVPDDAAESQNEDSSENDVSIPFTLLLHSYFFSVSWNSFSCPSQEEEK